MGRKISIGCEKDSGAVIIRWYIPKSVIEGQSQVLSNRYYGNIKVTVKLLENEKDKACANLQISSPVPFFVFIMPMFRLFCVKGHKERI